MNRLVSIIGPAPSELSWTALRQKLQHERERIRRGFEFWSSSIGRKAQSSGRKRGITLKDIRSVAKQMGVTVEEVEKLLAAELKRKEGEI